MSGLASGIWPGFQDQEHITSCAVWPIFSKKVVEHRIIISQNNLEKYTYFKGRQHHYKYSILTKKEKNREKSFDEGILLEWIMLLPEANSY